MLLPIAGPDVFTLCSFISCTGGNSSFVPPLPALSLSKADPFMWPDLSNSPSKSRLSVFLDRVSLHLEKTEAPLSSLTLLVILALCFLVALLSALLLLSLLHGQAAWRLQLWRSWEAMQGRPSCLPGACNIFELSLQMSPDLANSLE